MNNMLFHTASDDSCVNEAIESHDGVEARSHIQGTSKIKTGNETSIFLHLTQVCFLPVHLGRQAKCWTRVACLCVSHSLSLYLVPGICILAT